ncbi:MAG: SpoVG family protein [Candidatus Omnitrophica bacterium]|nr:SpoVG family protein [Candidatus Omnitrophota bacterium]
MSLDLRVTRLFRFSGEGPTKAVCDVVIGEEFLIKGFRIVEGKDGLFVSPPREKGKDGKWYSNALALTQQAKNALNEAVLAGYESLSE